MPFYWTFKFRSPINPSGQSTASIMHEVRLETDGDDRSVAEEVAQDYLTHGPVAHPNAKFVYLERDIVHSEKLMRARKTAEAKATVDAAKAAEKPLGQRVGA